MSIGGATVSFVSILLPTLPLILVLIAGIGVAIFGWSSYPRVALCATIGLGLELTVTILGVIFAMMAPFLIGGGIGAARFGALSAAVSIVLRLTSAVAWILVLAAVFIGRQGAAPGDGRGRGRA